MESEWRNNVWRIGLNNWGINASEYPGRIYYAAELITPLFGPGFFLPWLIQYFDGSQYLYYATNGFSGTNVPWFQFVDFDAKPFRPPYPVVPDS